MKALKWTLAATAVVTLMTLGAPIHAQAKPPPTTTAARRRR